MNTQESQQLEQFLQQLTAVRLTEKDQEAERLIRDAIARQPDAAYLLVQKSLLQDHALQVAQTKINELEQQLQETTPTPAARFLQSDPWAAAANAASGIPANRFQFRSSESIPTQNPIAAAQAANSGFGNGFLGNMASTAAGVVAGSFLFQGLGNLLGHHQSGLGQQAFNEHPSEQTVVNNYYGGQPSADPGNDNDYLADNDNDMFLADDDSGSDWV